MFVFDPVSGLSDMDFHPITDEGWKNMGSPGGRVTATLQVPSSATVAELKDAVATLKEKGGFTGVQLEIEEP